MATHHCLLRPSKVRLHGKAGMSHSMLGSPAQRQLGRRALLHTGSARVSEMWASETSSGCMA